MAAIWGENSPYDAPAQRLDRLLVGAVEEFGKPRVAGMSKLAALADRIRAKHAAHGKLADDYAARLDKVDAAEPDAFNALETAVAGREADLRELEQTVRALSNLGPLAGSDDGSKQGG